ncbi:MULTISPECIES: DUF6508 domain-containing protein [Pseudomonas syringae group]|uniref:DUF6508 domain-containing protein n=1 Tax=Pseudomonas syringae group TaxID=136849 RepID=UPI0013C369E0|nr:DUF6508 domain-containing protein [Pseudomonas viridiflava]MBD8568333.1 hypothetical protein [Pseudomonas syringae]MEE4227627.1 DUF6508 domain-containing protein [Pseudomonas viridiflava]MEE4231241.1 DUF6508 domain-containing protein [Pseudomonas viridiflava]
MMKLLHRLKSWLGQKAVIQQPDIRPESDEKTSRLQEQKPLLVSPPICPPLTDRDAPLLARYHAYIAGVEHADKAEPLEQSESQREEGRMLANALYSRALDLATSRAGEHSPDIYWLMQSAAIASLFADGIDSEAFLKYQKDVHHYKDQRLTEGQVWAFDLYVSHRFPIKPLPLLMHPSVETRLPSEPIPGPEDIDELLSYLPRLYPNGIAIETHIYKEGQYWPTYFDVVHDFFKAVAKDCWCDTHYPNHRPYDKLESPEYIAQANLADIQTFLTYCSRGERFCDGHHGQMIKEGYVLRVLNRLSVLRVNDVNP